MRWSTLRKTPQDPALSPKRHELEDARFHKVGSEPARDVIVRAASAGQSGLRPVLSSNGRWLLVKVWRGESRIDVYFEDLREARPTWRTLTEGRDATYDVRVAADMLLVRSDERAPNGQIFAVDPKTPERDAWRTLVAERADLPLMGFDLLGGALILRYRKDDIAHVEIRDLSGALIRELPSRGVGTTTLPSGTPASDEAYYGLALE